MKDGDGSRKSPSVAMGMGDTEPGNPLFASNCTHQFVKTRYGGTECARCGFTYAGESIPEVPEMSIDELNKRMGETYERPDGLPAATTVVVNRELLGEALAQLRATFVDATFSSYRCSACRGAIAQPSEPKGDPREQIAHRPGCRYVHVRDALKALL